METGRGKKGKKAGWHLSLGLMDVIIVGIGVVGLMSLSFTLGALAGQQLLLEQCHDIVLEVYWQIHLHIQRITLLGLASRNTL